MKRMIFILACSTLLFACKKNNKCDDGFTGDNCDIQMTPSTITMNEVDLTSYPTTKTDGSGWDISDGPDIFFVLYRNDAVIFTSNTVNDLAGTTSPVVYTTGMPFNISDVNANFTIKWYDADGILGDELMGSFNIDMYSDMNGFPQTLSFDNPDGSLFVFSFDVEYNF